MIYMLSTIEILKNEIPKKKINVLDLEGKKIKTILLPKIFLIPHRPDLVKRAFLFMQTSKFQPKGASKLSGHKYSVESLGAGYGMARVSRIKGGGAKRMSAAFVPFSVGGRPTHPPKPEKKIKKRLNKMEKILALLSAISMSIDPEIVSKRGHRIGKLKLPIVLSDDIQSIKKSNELKMILEKIGLKEEIERCSKKNIRAGKGKRRGRRYKRRVGPLIIVAKDDGIIKAASNIPGLEAITLDKLNILHLAPGAHPIRLLIWSESAISNIDKMLEKII